MTRVSECIAILEAELKIWRRIEQELGGDLVKGVVLVSAYRPVVDSPEWYARNRVLSQVSGMADAIVNPDIRRDQYGRM
jgi:hypothetical protein